VTKYVSYFIGKTYPHSLGTGLEFEFLHIFGSGFLSPAEKSSQSGKKSEPRTFCIMRSHNKHYQRITMQYQMRKIINKTKGTACLAGSLYLIEASQKEKPKIRRPKVIGCVLWAKFATAAESAKNCFLSAFSTVIDLTFNFNERCSKCFVNPSEIMAPMMRIRHAM
jgi:hypothetical protein